MRKIFDCKIILENGMEFLGYGFGCKNNKVTELVFNTSMVGYQEIISDPSYTYQSVIMTYPLIGNYGINDDDFETIIPSIDGLIVKEYNDYPSNFRSTQTLDEVMKKYGIVGVSGIDSRKLVRVIRDYGSQRALITSIDVSIEEGLKIIKSTPILKDAIKKVSCKEKTEYKANDEKFKIVAIDCGIKRNIIRSFNKRKVSVITLPYNTKIEDIEKINPDGIFLSNGPGDPIDATFVIELVKKAKGKYPIFGICLGHQIISLAYGASTYKLKFGHRGGNHPVKNLINGKIEITSQNHSYAVDNESLKNTKLNITHINLLDNTIEGVECLEDKIFSVQYHPESAPGPEDSSYLFDKFIQMLEENKNAKKK